MEQGIRGKLTCIRFVYNLSLPSLCLACYESLPYTDTRTRTSQTKTTPTTAAATSLLCVQSPSKNQLFLSPFKIFILCLVFVCATQTIFNTADSFISCIFITVRETKRKWAFLLRNSSDSTSMFTPFHPWTQNIRSQKRSIFFLLFYVITSLVFSFSSLFLRFIFYFCSANICTSIAYKMERCRCCINTIDLMKFHSIDKTHFAQLIDRYNCVFKQIIRSSVCFAQNYSIRIKYESLGLSIYNFCRQRFAASFFSPLYSAFMYGS